MKDVKAITCSKLDVIFLRSNRGQRKTTCMFKWKSGGLWIPLISLMIYQSQKSSKCLQIESSTFLRSRFKKFCVMCSFSRTEGNLYCLQGFTKLIFGILCLKKDNKSVGVLATTFWIKFFKNKRSQRKVKEFFSCSFLCRH